MVKKTIVLFLVAMLAAIIVIPASLSMLASRGIEPEKKQGLWEGPGVKLLINGTGEIRTIPLEQYLVGVVAAEMPAAFEMESLKAQAVAARTYTLRKMQLQNDKHPEADICDDPNHCQAWLSDEAMQARWGMTGYTAYKRKIQRAVQETQGLVLTYDKQLIDPVYHSTSGPRTENSEDVWQIAVPYLRSVECTWDTDSPRYQEEKRFTWEELDRLLGTSFAALPAATLNNSSNTIQAISSTATGRVKEAQVAGKIIPATELRKILGLNSTNLKLAGNNRGLTFTTTGFGHGVGMCQYGANGQAREGRNFAEILTYYYTGVKLMQLPGYR
jgi:stage II sporulation protein D